jgi:hypothetical protein
LHYKYDLNDLIKVLFYLKDISYNDDLALINWYFSLLEKSTYTICCICVVSVFLIMACLELLSLSLQVFSTSPLYLGSHRKTKICLLGLLLLLLFEQNAISINFLNSKIHQKENIKECRIFRNLSNYSNSLLYSNKILIL